jgi:hypothetical protein
MDKSKSVPFLNDLWEPGPELDLQTANSSQEATTTPSEGPSVSSWHYVTSRVQKRGMG